MWKRLPARTRHAAIWLACLGPFFYVSYGLANYVAGLREHVPAVVFNWETAIPFWAWTIFPYWSINVFYALSLFVCRNTHEVRRHGLRLVTAQIVAVSSFIVTPLRFTFGEPQADGAAGVLFAALRSFDQPFNQAPSLHIALAVILWDLFRRRLNHPVARAVLHLWTLLICGSVLTTYQHHFIDIPTGALLGVLSVWMWPMERVPSMLQVARLTVEPRRTRLAALYGAGSLTSAALALVLGGAGLWLLWSSVALAMVALNYLLFGTYGFQKFDGGRASWAARWLLWPYRLGARINAHWWTRGQAASSAVADGVHVGSLLRSGPARVQGLQLVDVCAELDPPRAPATGAVPMLDLSTPSPRALRRAALQVENAVRGGAAVLVCCALGYSRSAAAVATWLVMSGRARSVDEAIERVRLARPQVVLRPTHVAAIKRAVAGSGS
jgi:protein-tyrosine phosphatase